MLAYSSETYEIETKDVANLPDGKDNISVSDEIVIKIGNNHNYKDRTKSKDLLLRGRKVVQRALQKKQKYVKVRIAFQPGNAKFDFISPLIRVLRYKIRTYGSNTYHLSPKFIRKAKLERNIRTAENAYDFSNPLYHLDEQARKKAYKKLYNSMQKRGFDDKFPLDIMLCRNMGVKDTLNQGHHRMSVALDLGLKKVGVVFSSAGAAPRLLKPLFLLIAKINMFFKR